MAPPELSFGQVHIEAHKSNAEMISTMASLSSRPQFEYFPYFRIGYRMKRGQKNPQPRRRGHTITEMDLRPSAFGTRPPFENPANFEASILLRKLLRGRTAQKNCAQISGSPTHASITGAQNQRRRNFPRITSMCPSMYRRLCPILNYFVHFSPLKRGHKCHFRSIAVECYIKDSSKKCQKRR